MSIPVVTPADLHTDPSRTKTALQSTVSWRRSVGDDSGAGLNSAAAHRRQHDLIARRPVIAAAAAAGVQRPIRRREHLGRPGDVQRLRAVECNNDDPTHWQ